MNSELINRGDALAVAMHSKDPVEGIRNLPAADAVEVVHARWEQIGTGYDGDEEYPLWKCPKCSSSHLGHTPNFCPNCGARMDGE